MKQFLVDNNSNILYIFFTGWGCDESEFNHLKADFDVLILYDYCDLNIDFDFSKYKEINLMAFSAGVFVASIIDFDFKFNKKIAISGNPYSFDEKLGLSKRMQKILQNITRENADEFARNYLIKTDDEWKNFHHSRRSLISCRAEFENLKKLYELEKSKIKNIFDYAIFGEDDCLFDISAQKEFYGDKLKLVKNARHNMFFRINRYEDIIQIL